MYPFQHISHPSLLLLCGLCVVMSPSLVVRSRMLINPNIAEIKLNWLSQCLANPKKSTLFDNLPADFEPSDAVVDHKRQSVWIVSDDGTLAEFSLSDNRLLGHVKLDLPFSATHLLNPLNTTQSTVVMHSSSRDRLDLEGLTLIPSRPEFLYLGNEDPPCIVEFHITLKRITRIFPLAHQMGGLDVLEEMGGLEALTYIPNFHDHGFFFAGRQSDARVFVFKVPDPLPDDYFANGSPAISLYPLTLAGCFDPPGPGEDLSALFSIHGSSQLFCIFDKPQKVVELNLLNLKLGPITSESLLPAHALGLANHIDLSSESSHRVFMDTPFRGIEAFAFVMAPNGVEMDVYIGLDAKVKTGKGKKKLKVTKVYRYTCDID